MVIMIHLPSSCSDLLNHESDRSQVSYTIWYWFGIVVHTHDAPPKSQTKFSTALLQPYFLTLAMFNDSTVKTSPWFLNCFKILRYIPNYHSVQEARITTCIISISWGTSRGSCIYFVVNNVDTNFTNTLAKTKSFGT